MAQGEILVQRAPQRGCPSSHGAQHHPACVRNTLGVQVSDNSCYVKAPVRYTDHDVFVALFGVMGTVCNLILPASDVVRSPCFRGMGPSHSSLSEVTPTHVIRLTCHEARASSTQPPAPPPAARGGGRCRLQPAMEAGLLRARMLHLSPNRTQTPCVHRTTVLTPTRGTPASYACSMPHHML